MSDEIISTFYSAFQKKDWRTMQRCYSDTAVFSDPVFQTLTAKQARAMWHMLLDSGGNLDVTYSAVKTDGSSGSCHWDAVYLFSGSGRKVHNVITASFVFAGGKISKHTDTFDLWKWSGMALGWPGKLMGWSSFLHNKIRSKAKKRLFRFIEEHPEYQ